MSSDKLVDKHSQAWYDRDMNINTTQHLDGHNPSSTFSITLPVSGSEVSVQVWHPARRYGGELQPSSVNWSALGASAAADAEAYAQLLTRAAAEAGKLDAQHGFLDVL